MNKCPICDEWDYQLSSSPHKCPPKWLVNIPDYHGDEWVTIYAVGNEEAATKIAERYDDERQLMDGGEIKVLVMSPEKDGIAEFIVTGEAVPTYYALKI